MLRNLSAYAAAPPIAILGSGRHSACCSLPALLAVVLTLSACDEMVEPPPEGGGSPPQGGSFTPDRERVVGFPALVLAHNADEIAEEEAARVRAMHQRGGTGAGQLVGSVESGANPEHPDLTGKFPHTCALGYCDDGRPNRPDHSPLLDTDGHGTQVNGIIAARKNGSGVYGIAYDAHIASFGNTAPTYHPWGNTCDPGTNCPPGVSTKRHQWSALFDQETARGIDWLRSLGVRVTNFSWGRTYEWSREKESLFALTPNSVRSIMPKSLPAFAAYVRAGGVAVWAAGNGDSLHPTVEGMLPRYFPNLEDGWLAVVGLGMNGRIGVLFPLLRRRRRLVYRRARRGRHYPSRRSLDLRRRYLLRRSLCRRRSRRSEKLVPPPDLSADPRMRSRHRRQQPAL